jgi:hypothetical protein
MRSFAALVAIMLALAARPLAAQQIDYEQVSLESTEQAHGGGERFVRGGSAAVPAGIAAYGPFRVLGRTRAALVDVTDARSPAAFAAMMSAFPQIALLEMVECPGTEDDRANLRLGRMIRAAGIATWVPAGGSVRSGGVELFLAGVERRADPGAEFAVHAWIDVDGREAGDYAAHAPENAKYLAYYRQMGMSEAEARAFYAMTNSVSHADALWLTGRDMARWVRLDASDG